mgnify:CR=1 FL=1
MLEVAESDFSTLLAKARGDAGVWQDLYAQYRSHPRVVRERLFTETIEAALPESGSLRFVPPPPDGRRYGGDGKEGFRISIPAGK